MQTQTNTAHEASQKHCTAPSLSEVIHRLKEEKEQICVELRATPARDWNSPRFRELGNREDELHVTLGVLQRLGFQPLFAAEQLDAARYRWLRATQHEPCRDSGEGLERSGVIEPIFVCRGDGSSTALWGMDLDAAIDAAIAATYGRERCQGAFF